MTTRSVAVDTKTCWVDGVGVEVVECTVEGEVEGGSSDSIVPLLFSASGATFFDFSDTVDDFDIVLSLVLNMASMRKVTANPPATLIAETADASAPRTCENPTIQKMHVSKFEISVDLPEWRYHPQCQEIHLEFGAFHQE